MSVVGGMQAHIESFTYVKRIESFTYVKRFLLRVDVGQIEEEEGEGEGDMGRDGLGVGGGGGEGPIGQRRRE